MFNRNASLAFNQMLQEARALPPSAEVAFEIKLAYAAALAAYAMYNTDIDYKQHELLVQRIAVVRESRLAMLKCGIWRGNETTSGKSEPGASAAPHKTAAGAGGADGGRERPAATG